jgi:hypothetical protein
MSISLPIAFLDLSIDMENALRRINIKTTEHIREEDIRSLRFTLGEEGLAILMAKMALFDRLTYRIQAELDAARERDKAAEYVDPYPNIKPTAF